MDDLYTIIADVFQINRDDISDELGPNDIESWDSLGQLKLITALEAHYKVTFEIAEIFEIFKIRDIVRLLKNRGLV